MLKAPFVPWQLLCSVTMLTLPEVFLPKWDSTQKLFLSLAKRVKLKASNTETPFVNQLMKSDGKNFQS